MKTSLFSICLFLSAFLLFSIQPLVAKSLLPFFGGSSGVWTTISIFFSGIVLLGYGYAALLSYLNHPNRWRSVHISILILSLISFPVIFTIKSTASSPEWSIIKNLILQLGMPLLVLSATAPLLQFAYSQTRQNDAKDPYFLYSASNIGSLMALMTYPFIIERFLKLQNQYIYWNIGYLILMVLLCIVFYTHHFKVNNPKDLSLDSENHLKLKWFHPLYWIFLSFIPCSLMLGVISFISTDIAAIPLFWVIPLSLYLITFIIIFRKKELISYAFLSKNTTYLLILPLLSIILPVKTFPLLIMLFAHLLNFFVLTLICHQALYYYRPHPKYLTLFYLAMSLGGFLASLFNGIIAPNYFNYNYEYFIAMILALFALPKIIKKSDGWITYIVIVALLLAPKTNTFDNNHIAFIAVLFLIFLLHRKRISFIVSLTLLCIFGLKTYLFQSNEILDTQRNFYGMKQVRQENQFHVLINQSTLHGFQDMMDHHPKGETSYYGVIAPLIRTMTSQIHPMTTTIIGLGTGNMLCQFNLDNIVHMVEIDKQVINIAQNPRFFTYLKKCPTQIDIQQQDGRLFIQSLPDHSQDLIVIDAFSSDAIPVHLLTLEAFRTYQQKLTPQGGILIHITNRHLNLGPVIYANATRLNEILYMLSGKEDLQKGQYEASWIFLTKNPKWTQNLKDWKFNPITDSILWTDDFSNIISILNH